MKCGRLERKCRHWTHGITVILVVVVDVTTAKVHVPSVVAVVLSNTPVVAIFLRYCTIVTITGSAIRNTTAASVPFYWKTKPSDSKSPI